MAEPKVAVITGSTGGIGSAIANQLAGEGWTLILVNRNAAKAEAQKASLRDIKVTLIEADLMDVSQIKRAAEEILTLHPRIDTLFNNSGVLTSRRVFSAQGHESNYAVNTLAPYVMINALRPGLKRADGESGSMIVNTTSSAQNSAKALDVETLSDPAKIGDLTGAYSTTKLALTTMGSAMAPDLKDDRIFLRSVCPGAVLTPMTRSSDGMPRVLKFLAPLFFKQPEQQAAKMVHAAQVKAYGGRTGIYIADGKEKPVPKLANDPANQAALMQKLAEDVVAR